MSLSAEALAQLEGLDLQEARDGLNFASVMEVRQPLGADLSDDELAGLRNWDLSGVMAKLNGLSFVEPPPASVVAPEQADQPVAEERLPDWLRPAEEEEPAAAAEPEGKEAEEELAEAAAGSLAGAGGKMRSFFESRKGQMTLKGVEFAAGGVVGVAIAEISKLDPAWEAGIVIMAQSALGLSRLGTELGAQAIEVAEKKFPRFAGLSAKLAGEKGLSGVLRSIKKLAIRIQYRPFLMGLSVGIIGHSAFEMVTGHSIFPDVNAAEPTPGPAADTETPTVTSTETPTGTPTPEATPVSPEATQQIPGGGEVGGPEAGGGQPPVEQPVLPELPEEAAADQAAEAARQAALEAAEAQAAEAEMAARQAALEAATHVVGVQPGDTLTGLLDAAGSTDPYGVDFTNTVLQSADVLTGPQNPNRDMARALIDFIKAHPGGVSWRDAINGVGDLAKETVGGMPLKDAIAQATRMIYPGQEMKIVVGAAMP